MQLIKGDITELDLDCIVNAANEKLIAGGGVCGAIHKEAGKELALECKRIGHCGVGEARITQGYNLKAKHVIHTVGPIWHGGKHGENQYLFKKMVQMYTPHHVMSSAAQLQV